MDVVMMFSRAVLEPRIPRQAVSVFFYQCCESSDTVVEATGTAENLKDMGPEGGIHIALEWRWSVCSC